MEQRGEQDVPAKKNELILEAAAQVFSANGFHRATVEEIAQRAGVGKGTIYEYFSSKKELFQQLIMDRMEKMVADLEKKLSRAECAEGKLRIMIDEGLDHFHRFEHINKILMTEATNADDEKMRMVFFAKREAIIALITGIIAEGIKEGRFRKVDELLAAQSFMGALNSIILSSFVYGKGKKPDPGAVLDLFLNGLSA